VSCINLGDQDRFVPAESLSEIFSLGRVSVAHNLRRFFLLKCETVLDLMKKFLVLQNLPVAVFFSIT
jgi:hypothetical protein